MILYCSSSQHNSLILHYNPETRAADTRQHQDIFMPSFLHSSQHFLFNQEVTR